MEEDIVYNVDVDISQAKSGMNKLEKQAKSTGDEFDSLGKSGTSSLDSISSKSVNVDSQLKTLGVGLGAAVVGIAAASTAAAMSFDETFTKASTLFGDTEVEVDSLKDSILSLSNETGVAAIELNEGLYQALSAGVDVTEDMSEAMSFLETNSMLAVAGFTDVETAVDATSSILNAYGLEVSEVESISQMLIRTQNLGKTTVDELGASISNVTPTAAGLGVEFDQVAASLAVMTAQGIGTSEATTKLNQLFVELGKSGTTGANALEAAQEAAGLAPQTFQEMIEDGQDLASILDLISEYADTSSLSMNDMFSSTEAASAALTIASDQDGFVTALGTMNSEVDDLGEAFDTVADGDAKAFADALNEITNAGIVLGTTLLPILADLATDLADFITDWQAGWDVINEKGYVEAVSDATKGMDFFGENWKKGADNTQVDEIAGGVIKTTIPVVSAVDNVINGIGAWADLLGFRANGGPVEGNNPFIVGERGPELFVPNTSGSIVTNNQLQGGGSEASMPSTMILSVGGEELVATITPMLTSTVKVGGGY